jgi:RNA polymerase sigma factor (sigma-70 family)
MSDPRVEAAVGLWGRRIGPTAVFDRDDARQEATIALWLAGPAAASTAAYRRIIDAIRLLVPGFRARQQLVFADAEHQEPAHDLTPEAIAMAREVCRRMSDLPPRTREVVQLCVEGKSYAEIAAQLGIGEARVSQHLTAATAFAYAQHHPHSRGCI